MKTEHEIKEEVFDYFNGEGDISEPQAILNEKEQLVQFTVTQLLPAIHLDPSFTYENLNRTPSVREKEMWDVIPVHFCRAKEGWITQKPSSNIKALQNNFGIKGRKEYPLGLFEHHCKIFKTESPDGDNPLGVVCLDHITKSAKLLGFIPLHSQYRVQDIGPGVFDLGVIKKIQIFKNGTARATVEFPYLRVLNDKSMALELDDEDFDFTQIPNTYSVMPEMEFDE